MIRETFDCVNFKKSCCCGSSLMQFSCSRLSVARAAGADPMGGSRVHTDRVHVVVQ